MYSQNIIQVPLGVLPKNENKTSDMVSIMQEMHSYVPTEPYMELIGTDETIEVPNAKIHPILFGGDQLTAARARAAKAGKVNSIDPSMKFNGLVPVAEDWHIRLNLLGVKSPKKCVLLREVS